MSLRKEDIVAAGNGTGLSRRQFLGALGGLVVGVALPPLGSRAGWAADAATDTTFVPNAFVRIGTDNTVTVLSKHIEFGQGPYTGLATLVADELDAAWAQVRVEAAPADVTQYANLAFGIQGTGGSTAIANAYLQMRRAGAAARAMLVAAAAREWQVDPASLRVSQGVVSDPASGLSATFGELAGPATLEAAPKEPTLKTPDQFVYIGKHVPRVDSAAKSRGEATFTIDIYREGMKTVLVAHPPKFGATVKAVDASEALAIDGVERVETIASGVAVYAKNTWAAMQGRNALKVEWDESAAETRSTDVLLAQWREAAKGDGAVAETHGDVTEALAGAAQTYELTFEFPYLAHAPLEPLDGVIEWKDGVATLWMGSQLQTVDQGTVAGVLGIEPAQVAIHTQLAGGSFGRRAQPDSHFAAEVAMVAKAAGDGVYKLLWTREDDIRGGYYRPLTVHRLRGGLDADGNIVAWDNMVVNQSIATGSPFESALVHDGIDKLSVEGSIELPYALPNRRVSWAWAESRVPVLWWRSVGHTHTAYATEVFLDALLAKAGKDPVIGRLGLLSPASREHGVLSKVAGIAGWSGADVGNGRARGVAVRKSFGSFVATIAEVSLDEDGAPVVHKVWCAIDCGVVVNPDIVVAQIEGGIGYALNAAMHSAIHLDEGGSVREGNFDSYPLLRIDEMPAVEVAIVPSDADPTGVGEPGVPPLAPAVANAMRVLSGEVPVTQPFRSA